MTACAHHTGWQTVDGDRFCRACGELLGPEINARTPTVAYVSGRRRALARKIAQAKVDAVCCLPWEAMSETTRERLVGSADAEITEWIQDGTLIEFLHEYKEKTG